MLTNMGEAKRRLRQNRARPVMSIMGRDLRRVVLDSTHPRPLYCAAARKLPVFRHRAFVDGRAALARLQTFAPRRARPPHGLRRHPHNDHVTIKKSRPPGMSVLLRLG